MKKNLFKQMMLILLAMLLSFQCPTPVMAVEESEEDVIVIETEEDLREMAGNCAFDNWSWGKTFVLQNDIQLLKADFLPIPTFGGTFEGNGHTISGVYVTDSVSPAGLFGVLQEKGVIKDLNVKGKIAASGEADTLGGIVGNNCGIIQNSTFAGYIKGESNSGGITGINGTGGEIRNCRFYGDVMGEHSTGGIVGWNKGTIFGCVNEGDINISGEDIEYEMPELSLGTLVNLNSTENMAAYTDTGGIAGFSEGKIYYCINEGTVGYQHVGYNVGGIAGRTKQGYIQNCTNEGTILGRKDVGGITGQIEPLMEVEYLTDKFQILDQELDEFLNLMDQTYSSIGNMGSKASGLIKDITYYVNTARVAAGGLSADSEEFYDSYNQSMSGMNQGLNKLNNDLNEIDWETGDDAKTPELPEISLPGGGDEEDTDPGGNDSDAGTWRGDSTDDNIDTEEEDSGNNITDNLPDTNPYENEMNATKNAVNNFLGTTGESASDMNEASWEYSEDMKYHMSAINANLEEAGEKLDELTQVLIEGSDAISGDMSAVMDQAQELRRVVSEIRDDMFQYEEVTTEDISDEKASKEVVQIGAGEADVLTGEVRYDMDSFQRGKVTRCLNGGTVEADINVGGIVGIMATEYDADPEDDIEVKGDTSLNVSQTAKVVVRDSRNEGIVTAKKNCAGGIAGKTELGAIISCESYGTVESISGDYVGGIAGEAAGTIKNSFAKCTLSGKNYVGGIIGRGTDAQDMWEASMVSSCYSMVTIEEGKQYIGAIAGSKEGVFSGNYFISDSLRGINQINYNQKAEPVDYDAMQSREIIPQEFKTLKVKFVVEDKVIKTKEFTYGQTLSSHVFPEIPEKRGHYAVWDKKALKNLQTDTVVTAEYIPYIMAVSSEECRTDGRPIFFVEGDFKEDDILKITDKTEETMQGGIKNNGNTIKEENVIEYWILNIPDNTDAENYVVHYLSDDAYKKVKFYVYENKQWKKVTCEEEGSYYLFSVTGNRAEIIVTK